MVLCEGTNDLYSTLQLLQHSSNHMMKIHALTNPPALMTDRRNIATAPTRQSFPHIPLQRASEALGLLPVPAHLALLTLSWRSPFQKTKSMQCVAFLLQRPPCAIPAAAATRSSCNSHNRSKGRDFPNQSAWKIRLFWDCPNEADLQNGPRWPLCIGWCSFEKVGCNGLSCGRTLSNTYNYMGCTSFERLNYIMCLVQKGRIREIKLLRPCLFSKRKC